MTNAFVQNLLLPLVRGGMGLPAQPVALTEPDFERLRRLGNRQMLTPVLWHGMQALQVGAEWLERVDHDYLKALYQGLLRQEALERLLGVLERAGVDHIPLKGAELAALYPEPWMRTSVDIDILVREPDLQRAVRAVEEATTLRAGKRGYHDVLLSGEGIQLELHFSLKENLPQADPLLERAWEFAEQRAGHRYAFTCEFQIFHILAHMSYHMRHGGLGIRNFLDLWLLRHKTDYDAPTVRRLCEQAGLLRFYETCCALSEVWLSGAPHTPTTEALERWCLRGGVFGSTAVAAAADLREEGALLRRIFLPRRVLQEIHPALRKRPYLLPYYQLKRWTHLLHSRKRRAVWEEIRRAKRADAGRIETFEQLLRSVGM